MAARISPHPSHFCRSGGIGRRAWFRSMYPQGCGGSSPFFGTMLSLGFPRPTENYERWLMRTWARVITSLLLFCALLNAQTDKQNPPSAKQDKTEDCASS